jgi:hypothetical protein
MNGTVEIKVDTHIVIKREDAEKYLSPRQEKQLAKILDTIDSKRSVIGKKHNNYYVCNTDEPYAKEVYDEILIGELKKQSK